MRLLVTGGTGKLGAAVVTRASAAGHDVVATTRRSSSDRGTRARTRRSSSDRGTRARIEIPRRRFLDITDAEACHTIVRDVAPDVVIHTAYDAGDWRVTADGAVNVARATAGAGAHLVFVSSDAIFSGADSPYDEQARPDPVTRYGAAKAAAETAIRAVLPTATIARSSLILGPDSSMERLVHALAGGGDGILFTDQIRCPVHRDDLATALLELAGERRAGIFHCGGADAISRVDMGRLIARRDGLDFDRIRIGSRADLGPGQQLDVRLDSRHTQELLRTTLRGAQEFLRA